MENVEEKILSDTELENYFEETAIGYIVREIKKYPLLSEQEFTTAFTEYKNGSKKAEDLIVNSNLRLVLSVAKKYVSDKKSLQLEDLFQEGTIGLMRALKTYDPEEGKFSTYAFMWIRQIIQRAGVEKDDTIRRAYSFSEAKKKYNRLYTEYQVKGIPLPSKEEIMRILKISSGIYELILEDVKKSTLSLNSFVDDDGETELGDFIPVIEDGYKRVNQKIDDHNLLLVLKTALPKHEYYVLYYRVLIGESLKLEELGEKLTLTRERIRQIEEKAKKKAEKYVVNKNTLYRQKVEELTNKYGKNLEKVKDEPINVDMIFMYLFLRENLTDVEKDLFKNLYFSDINYTHRELLSLMNISKETYLQTLSSLNKKIKMVREQEEDIFKLFKKKLAKKYTTKLFYLDLDSLDFQDILTMDVDEIERENSPVAITTPTKTPEQSEETSNEESLDFDLNTSDILPNNLPDSQSVITKEDLNPAVLLIIQYLYIKEMLSKHEREVYKLFYLKNKSKEDVISYLSKKGFTADYFDLVIVKIKDLVNNYINRSKKAFDYFINGIVAKYGLEIDIRKIDTLYIKDCFAPPEIYLEVLKSYQNYMFSDLENIFQEELGILTEDELNLLKRFYNIFPDIINPTVLERELNLTFFGYNPESERLNHKLLLDTYLNNIDSYTPPQRLYLETHILGLKPKSLFKRAYPEIVNIMYYDFLLDRLERQYFGIYRLFDNSFTKEKWLQIKEKYLHKFSSRKITLLDLYYGVNTKPKSMKEIATMFPEDYNTIHDELSDARDFACFLYYFGPQTIEYNPEFYIGYINDEKFEMTPETRTVLRLFMIEHKTYEEISNHLNITRSRVSNIITDAIWRMDAYRFGILKEDNFTAYKLKKILTFAGERFSSVEIKIIFDRKINGLSVNETAEKYRMSKADINSIITKFNDCILAYNIANVDLTTEDVKKELRTHRSESVLSEKQKMIISYYYGIKNEYNPEGCKYSSGQIQKHFRFTNISTLIRTLKGKKIGLIKPVKINRADMIKYLKDPHLPISDKERDIICYLYELEGHELKTIAEIAKIYNEGPSSVNRRYTRAIVNIFKYRNKEIPGQINFKVDVEPFLKYFCVLDANILIDYFRDNLTCEQIAYKYGLTYAIIYKKVSLIKMRLLEMREDPNSKKFDFDFYRKNVFNPFLPLHGDIKLSKEIFDLFMAENSPKSYSSDDIAELLSLNCSSARVRAAIFSLMIASCKLQMGIKKAKSFTKEEILEHYLKHKDNMSASHLRYYETYFKSELKINSNNSQVHSVIINDLLKSKHKDYIYLAQLADDQVKRLLKSKRLTPELIDSLLSFYEIPAVTIMSSKDLMELCNIFYKLEKAFVSKITLSLQEPLGLNFKDPFMQSVLEEANQRNILSNSEFDSLFAKMQKGDNKAKQELYNKSIKIILYILNNFFNGQEEKIKSSFQVALLALQDTINSYNGKTNYLIMIYAKVINNIGKLIQKADYDIDEKLVIEYNRLLDKYHGKLPEDTFVCNVLDIDFETLSYLKKNFRSADKGSEIDYKAPLDEEFIEKQELLKIRNFRLALKVLLKPQEYYLLYYCCLYPNLKSYEEIANTLDIQVEWVRKLLRELLNSIRKNYFTDAKKIDESLEFVLKKYGSFEVIKEEPIEVEKILEFVFLKKQMTAKEIELFRIIYFEDKYYSYEQMCSLLEISLSELKDLIASLKSKIEGIMDSQIYNSFKKKTISTLNSQVFYIPSEEIFKNNNAPYLIAEKYLLEIISETNSVSLKLKSTT